MKWLLAVMEKKTKIFNVLSKLKQAANCVRFCLNPFCCEVHEGCLLTTKTIEIKPYTICSSHQLGLEVESRVERYILLFAI